MKKKIFIGLSVLVVLLIVGGIIVSNIWGEYESKLEKSELIEAEVDRVITIEQKPSFEKLDGQYEVNAATSDNAEILFQVEGLKNTKGGFDAFNVTFSAQNTVESATIKVEIEAESINTGNGMRDKHLKEIDFFHVEKYPKITFESDEISWDSGVYAANGTLNLMKEINPLKFDFKHIGGGENKDNKLFEAFEGTIVFDRTAYGMEEDASVGNEVTLTFYLELVKV